MRLKAPYPGIQTITILPEPELGNEESLLDEIKFDIMMDNTRQAYKKTTNDRSFRYTFILTIAKMFELQAFVEAYIADLWEIEDHHNKRIRGYCTSNPLVLTQARRGDLTTNIIIGEEIVTCELTFEGIYV
jgi:hypothetical protein